MAHVSQAIPKMRPRFAGGAQGGRSKLVACMQAADFSQCMTSAHAYATSFAFVPPLWLFHLSVSLGSATIHCLPRYGPGLPCRTTPPQPTFSFAAAFTLRCAVTFVALGNGAPDLSANIAAISAGEVVLSAGAFTGAAMFVQVNPLGWGSAHSQEHCNVRYSPTPITLGTSMPGQALLVRAGPIRIGQAVLRAGYRG
jgi:hypothetical protein